MRFFEFFIAWRYMTSNIRQSLIILAAVGIGVSIIIFVPSINLSFFNDLIDKSVSSAPHITVKRELETFDNVSRVLDENYEKKFLLKDQTITRRRTIKSYKSVISDIENVDGITATSPYISGQGIAVRGAEEIGVNIRGVIAEREAKVVDIEEDIIEGRFSNISINDVVIGVELAEKLNVGIGDRFTLIGSKGEAKTFKVIGIFSTGLIARDEGQVYVNLKSAQQLFGIGNDVVGVGINVDDIYEADKVADKVQNITKLTADSWMTDNKQILDQLARFRVIIAFINFLIIFAAASSITSILVMMIASKSKEIGIMKSIGAKSFSILVIFVSQAIILGLLGYLCGVLGAKILINWYISIISQAKGTFLTTEIPEIKMNFEYAMLALFYSVFTSFLASLIPAYQAAKLNPVEAINA